MAATSRSWAPAPARASDPAVRVDRAGTRLTLPVRISSWASRLDLLWTAVWAAAEVFLLAALVRAAREPDGPAGAAPSFGWLLAFFLLMTAAGLFLLWRVQWLLLGREVVELLPGGLRFRRQALWAGRWTEIPFARLRGVRHGHLHEDPIYPSWGRRFVGKAAGSVVLLLADGGRRVLGRGLGEDDARRVADVLRRHLEASGTGRADGPRGERGVSA